MKTLGITTLLVFTILLPAVSALATDFGAESRFVSEFSLKNTMLFEGISNTISKTAIASSTVIGKKNPWTAFILSALLPGAGQYYNDQLYKGVIQFVVSVGGYAVYYLALEDNIAIWGSIVDVDGDDAMGGIGVLIGLGAHLWSVIDAPISANNINKQNQFQAHLIEYENYSVSPLVKKNKLGAMFTLQF